jgi:hypothetical protein
VKPAMLPANNFLINFTLCSLIRESANYVRLTNGTVSSGAMSVHPSLRETRPVVAHQVYPYPRRDGIAWAVPVVPHPCWWHNRHNWVEISCRHVYV